PGGVGKTRLALQVAREVHQEFADGVCFVELAPIRDPALVLPTIASAFGLIDAGDRALAERLVAYLRPRLLLLVLDNLEHLVDSAPELAQLLSGCPRLKILATGRVVLHLTDEHDMPVAPLPVREAVHLFVARAQAAVPAFSLTAENATPVASIC